MDTQILLFPFQDYWWFYGLFTTFVLITLALDLGIFHKKAHAVSYKEAVAWTIVWVTMSLMFSGILYAYSSWKFGHDPRLLAIPGFDPEGRAKQVFLEFITGYILEQSLAVDNLFVFVVVFRYFNIPSQLQHRVLFFGILGAVIFRAIFIGMGSLIMAYQWGVFIMGVFLILTGLKMVFGSDKPMDPEKNMIVKVMRKIFPVHPHIEGQKFFIIKEGKRYITPLFIALIFLEFTDIVFALDSVPAIFAITKEPMIVFTSNICAILGLRSIFFLVAGMMDSFVFLKYGLAAVLIFVGLKMTFLNEAFGGHFPIGISLAVIAFCIGTSVLLSLLYKREQGHQ